MRLTAVLYLLASVPVAIWLYLLLGRGSFWLEPARNRRPAVPGTPRRMPRTVIAVIPARNEATLIADTVRALLQQRFDGSLRVIVVDDASRDGTAAAAAGATALGESGRLMVVSATALPPGWSGKLWAMTQGLEVAQRLGPDYVLFTDADIHHEPDSIAALVEEAEQGGADLVSRMVTLAMRSPAEKWLMPAFVFFFFMLYPPAWIGAPRSRTAAAAGGCMLVRPAALERVGGLAAIRSRIIDDCALAQAVKGAGGRISLALTDRAHSTRSYGSWQEIARLISRTAFNQLRHSYALLGATLLGLLLTYVLPLGLLLSGRPLTVALGVTAWLLMAVAYTPMLRYYRRSRLWALSLPAISVFYAVATVQSAWRYHRGQGGAWKGRIQDARANAG